MCILKKSVLYSIALFIFIGCSSKIEQKPNISKANFQKILWKDLDGFKSDDLGTALEVFQKDCQSSSRYKNLTDVCTKASEPQYLQNPSSFFIQNFNPYQLLSDDGDTTGMITGYYEPLLQGSYTQTKRFQYPVYEVPSNLITINLKKFATIDSNSIVRGKLYNNTIIPYQTREEIESINHKDNTNLTPICFVDNKIDLFFLQIQGSGKIQLTDGSFINIGYGEQNGHSYYAIGKKLIEMGAIQREDISLQSIKKWLEEHPDTIDEILNFNKSYVFFKQSTQTATGSLGTELTANRNIAVDRKNIPLGFPVFINTTNPITKQPIKKLMVAADTGGAIKGKIRADLFFGYGEAAAQLAGKMKQQGELFLLIPNTINTHKE